MKILVLAPLTMSKKLIPLLKPFVKTKELSVDSMEFYGTLLNDYYQSNVSDTAATLCFAQAGNLIDELLEHKYNNEVKHNVIIGPLGLQTKVDKVIVLYPDMVEAQEEIFNKTVEYMDKYYLSVDADYTANSETEFLKVLDLCLKNKKQEKILH